ncbi:hypothetical protein LTR28_000559, partial [Elasticomyces elasticus]
MSSNANPRETTSVSPSDSATSAGDTVSIWKSPDLAHLAGEMTPRSVRNNPGAIFDSITNAGHSSTVHQAENIGGIFESRNLRTGERPQATIGGSSVWKTASSANVLGTQTIGDPFTGGPTSLFAPTNGHLSTSQRQLQPQAPPFSPMTFLNADSTPDDAGPTIVRTPVPSSNLLVSPQRGSAASSSTASPVGTVGDADHSAQNFRGQPFSTDLAPNMPGSASRFMMVQGVPKEAMEKLRSDLDRLGIWSKMRAYAIVDHPVNSDLFFSFDDLRDAQYGLDSMHIIDATLVAQYICQDVYYNADAGNEAAQSLSPWDGQVRFVATFTGPVQDLDVKHAESAVFQHATSCGEVRSFETLLTARAPNVEFRVEYFKQADCQRIVSAAVTKPEGIRKN